MCLEIGIGPGPQRYSIQPSAAATIAAPLTSLLIALLIGSNTTLLLPLTQAHRAYLSYIQIISLPLAAKQSLDLSSTVLVAVIQSLVAGLPWTQKQIDGHVNASTPNCWTRGA
jgi:hypothetical protein